MVLRYNISPDDIVAFNLFLLKNVPAMRRSAFWVKWRLTFPLCVIIMGMGVYYSDPRIAVAGVLFFALTHVRFNRRIRRHLMKQAIEGSSKEILGMAEVEIKPDGLISRSLHIETKIDWEKIDRIEVDGERTYIFLGERRAIVLPRKSVTEGDCDAFIQMVNGKILSDSPNLIPK